MFNLKKTKENNQLNGVEPIIDTTHGISVEPVSPSDEAYVSSSSTDDGDLPDVPESEYYDQESSESPTSMDVDQPVATLNSMSKLLRQILIVFLVVMGLVLLLLVSSNMRISRLDERMADQSGKVELRIVEAQKEVTKELGSIIVAVESKHRQAIDETRQSIQRNRDTFLSNQTVLINRLYDLRDDMYDHKDEIDKIKTKMSNLERLVKNNSRVSGNDWETVHDEYITALNEYVDVVRSDEANNNAETASAQEISSPNAYWSRSAERSFRRRGFWGCRVWPWNWVN